MATGGDDYSYLRRRLARLEAVVAAMFAFDDSEGDPELYEEFLYRLRRSYEREFMEKERQFPEPEFFFLLEELLSPKRRRRPRWEQRFSVIEERTQKAESTAERLHSVLDKTTSQLRMSVESSTKELSGEINALRRDHDSLQHDSHGFFAIQSMGLDLNEVPLTRFVPIRVYLSDDDPQQVRAVSSAIQELVNVFGFEVSDEFPAEKGSFWKKWFVKTKDVATQPEVAKRLEKIERAIEMKGLHAPQADIDKKEAEAVATLAKAVENVPNAAIQAGSILLVKIQNPNHGSCIQVRTLTQRELIHLEKNQKLLASPSDILERLSDLSNQESETVHATALPPPDPET